MALPASKLLTTVVRTWARPVAARLVAEASEHQALNFVVLAVGRRYLQVQRQWASIDATIARGGTGFEQEAAKERMSPGATNTSGGDGGGGGHPPAASGGGSSEGAASTTATSIKAPLSHAEQEAKATYMAKVAAGLIPFRRAQRRPKIPEPSEDELKRAGAFVVVEAMIYGMMVAVVWYEWRSSVAEGRAKAKALEDRFLAIETRLENLQLSVDGSEDARRESSSTQTDREPQPSASAVIRPTAAVRPNNDPPPAAPTVVRRDPTSMTVVDVDRCGGMPIGLAMDPTVWMGISGGLAILGALNSLR